MVWAAAGRDRATLGKFFNALGEDGCAALQLVSAEGADYIADMVALRAPQAEMCMDPFYGDLRVMPTWRLSCLVGTVSAARRSA
jgi:transposase